MFNLVADLATMIWHCSSMTEETKLHNALVSYYLHLLVYMDGVKEFGRFYETNCVARETLRNILKLLIHYILNARYFMPNVSWWCES